MPNSTIRAVLWAVPALLLPVLPLAAFMAGSWYSFFHDYSLGMTLGIFAYGYFMTVLILSARIPFLDRRFGHDRVMVFHGCLACTALGLAIGHYIFKYAYADKPDLQIMLGSIASLIFSAVILVSLLFMVTGTVHRIPLFAKLKRLVNRTWIGDYSRLKLIHNAAAAAVILIGLHVYLASSTRASRARMLIMGGWAAGALLVYVLHKFIRPAILYRNRWELTGVREPAPGFVELSMQPGRKALKKHSAGQFAYFRFLSPVSGREEHPFTISSAPDQEELSVTIKSLGDYTARLKDIPVGTPVLVDGPYGVFTPRPGEHPLLFIAGGIGITPFLAILKSPEFLSSAGPATLVWSCRTADEMIYRDFLESCAEEYSRFTFVPLTTREGDKRRIDRALLESLFEPEQIKTASAYICGPEELRRSAAGILKTLGCAGANIRYERFS